ncbi:L-asparaginase 1 [archaeon HR01]|nr:L-asparaginase 1 [archaeon HR01]
MDGGYTGLCRRLISEAGASIGDEVLVVTRKGEYRGFLMMRYELGAADHIVLKLANGYNIGVKVWDDSRVVKLSESRPPSFRAVEPPPPDPGLPHVAVISTGGTIASRVDYRTGGVRPALTASDLLSAVPELSGIARISAEVLMSIYSENMNPRNWALMAERVDSLLRSDVDGVVIAHGTDTMGYSAAALSFVLQQPPKPVVLVGSQRSSDRPSSDAALNLVAAVDIAAKAPIAEVGVCMHLGHSDDVIAFHRGVRVVKLHTSSRSAFKSVNCEPLALWTRSGLKIQAEKYHRRGGDDYRFMPGFDERALLLKFYPGMSPEVLEVLRERLCLRGVVLEGTGLGHVSSSFIPTLKRLRDEGVFVGMTSQCRYGRVDMLVYDNGRDLLRAGVVPLDNMLAETALVKLMWVLARAEEYEEVKRLMATNLVGEMGGRSMPEGVG